MIDDLTLVKRANKGDGQAFSLLLERHYDLIYRLGFRMLQNQADAEDLAQDICVSLASKLHSFRGQSKLSTWLYQVTMNCARDFLRRRATIAKIHGEFADLQDLQKGAEAQHKDDVEWAYNAINSMSEDLRETALLIVAEGLSHNQAGEILNVKEATVSWRMMKVREHLKALVSDEAKAETGK